MIQDQIRDSSPSGWKQIDNLENFSAFECALGIFGLTPSKLAQTRALDLMPDVIGHCEGVSKEDFYAGLELAVEAGQLIGRELDALRFLSACIGISEVDWATLELVLKLGDPSLSMIGRQGKDNSVDNGTVSSICLLYTSPSPRDRQKSRMPSSA